MAFWQHLKNKKTKQFWFSKNTKIFIIWCNRPIPIYQNTYLATRLGGIKQKKCSIHYWASRWLLLFYSLKSRSQVWILIYRTLVWCTCEVVLTFESADKILQCGHSNETSSAVISVSYCTVYLVRTSNLWVCGWNPIVLPFKWNHFGNTNTWSCLFISIFKMKFGHFVISEWKGNTGTIYSLCNLPLLASSSQLPGLAHLVQLEWIHQMNQTKNLARTAWNCWVFQFWLLLTTRKNTKHAGSWNKNDVFLSWC